jgi:hypothetical protein
MPTNLREIINVSLVILDQDLLSDDAQMRNFQEAVDLDIRLEGGMAANVVTGQIQPSRTLHLDRVRISLNLSGPRSMLKKEFPALSSLGDELNGFAEVAQQAIMISELGDKECNFGYNADMVFEQDSEANALGFLGTRLLAHEVFSKSGREFIGGTGRVMVRDGSGQWTYSFEPRAGDIQGRRVFVGTNLHLAQQPLPDISTISKSLGEVVDSAKDLMSRLDERVQDGE